MNEVAARRRFDGELIEISGLVVKIGFLTRRNRVSETESYGVAAPIGRAVVASGHSRTTERTEVDERPYINVEGAQGGRVHCYLGSEEGIDAVRKGQPVTLVGVFSKYSHDYERPTAIVLDCRLVERVQEIDRR